MMRSSAVIIVVCAAAFTCPSCEGGAVHQAVSPAAPAAVERLRVQVLETRSMKALGSLGNPACVRWT
jgi:hypothetical protein